MLGNNFNNSIIGKVKDSATGEPLPGVNVYLSNTSMGAATDVNGKFLIKNIPPGEYKIVASMVGYSFRSYDLVIDSSQTVEQEFFLRAKSYKLDQVEVRTEIPDEWFDNLRIFKKHFFGKTEYTQLCTIKNQEVIDLEWKGDKLYASSPEPIVIINKALGYKILCNIETFYYSKKTGKSWLKAFNFFSELVSDEKTQIEEWENARKETFINSPTHFFLWLKNKNVTDPEYKLTLQEYSPSALRRPTLEFVLVNGQVIEPSEKLGEHILVFENYLNIKISNIGKKATIKLLHEEVRLDAFGYPLESKPYEVYGFWGDLGMANQLPMFYHIDKVF